MAKNLLDALVTKLTATNVLNGDDIRAILALPVRSRRLGPHEPVAQDGARPDECCLLGEGFAYRSKNTPDGQRQILSIHIPGEIPDLQSLHLKVMDHDLMTLSSCTLGFIAHSALRQLNIERPQVAAALWRETLVDAAIFREWIVNVGRRAGPVRMSHLLSELRLRLHAIGRTQDGTFDLPITQGELGDCLGLSTVHVNRVLKDLRAEGLIRTDRAIFRILDEEKLQTRGQFDPTYLHLS